MSSNPVEALRQTPNQSFQPTSGLSSLLTGRG